jgi:uncharacterized protein (TIGR00375 family)
MIPKKIAEGAKLKGLNLVGSGDALHERWLKYMKELNVLNEGIFEWNGIYFILQAEVEDKNRVHHLIFFPSLSKVEELRETFSRYGNLADGRPKLDLSGSELLEYCKEAGCEIGFAHAFTPYFGLYSKYDSYKDCYGDWRSISFMELGLSADTKMADSISELHELSFLSCSDSHSPWPHRLGREATLIDVDEISYDSLMRAIKGKRIKLNIKLNPKEGKYHATRCRNCLTFFSLQDAKGYRWKCPACGGIIKKGVIDRIEELRDSNSSPSHRPRCLHIIPLSEIISVVIGKGILSKEVQDIWNALVGKFGNEIKILTSSLKAENEIERKVFDFIALFRENKIVYVPGGAGEYGKVVPPWKRERMKVWKNGKVQEVEICESLKGQGQTALSDFI